MKIFKFGGASVKNAEAVQNMSHVVLKYAQMGDKLLVVVSAMGKTTNALERIINAAQKQDLSTLNQELMALRAYHHDIIHELFPDPTARIYELIDLAFAKLEKRVSTPRKNYNKHYDQIVSMGELISSRIVAEYLKTLTPTLWVDARAYVRTDESWREGKVDWASSEKAIQNKIPQLAENHVLLTQGFIGGTLGKKTTTLGREGSDYTAAIFAYCTKAESVTIWKDVPGILNADPKRLSDTKMYERLAYVDAAEMTYYGASVIHPKTIKPLANKNIPLHVKSFIKPEDPGTTIAAQATIPEMPAVIFKPGQCLIHLLRKNLSAISDSSMAIIFSILERNDVVINLVQSSAVTLSICVNDDVAKIRNLKPLLEDDFDLKIQDRLELVTIKNYDQSSEAYVKSFSQVLLEQRSGQYWHLIVPAS
ncbi:MAG: aspartate kinase [Cytophagales bacterium]|nr:MAG: aspartate kinase [Cytophagales bacterium]